MLYPVELRGREANTRARLSSWKAEAAVPTLMRENGVGNGNRTRNRWSHSPVLCQLSYSHRRKLIIASVDGSRRLRPATAQPRRGTAIRRDLNSAYAHVLKAQGAQARGVKQILCVDNDGLLQQMFDAIEVECAEFRPARPHDQGVGPFGSRIG